MEGQALPHAQCTLCGALADRERACSRTGEPLTEDAGLPPAAMNLVVIQDSTDPMQGKDRLRQLKQCPQWMNSPARATMGASASTAPSSLCHSTNV